MSEFFSSCSDSVRNDFLFSSNQLVFSSSDRVNRLLVLLVGVNKILELHNGDITCEVGNGDVSGEIHEASSVAVGSDASITLEGVSVPAAEILKTEGGDVSGKVGNGDVSCQVAEVSKGWRNFSREGNVLVVNLSEHLLYNYNK